MGGFYAASRPGPCTDAGMVKYGQPAALAGGSPDSERSKCMRGVRGVRVGALLVVLGLMVAACGGGDDEGGSGDTGGGSTAEAKKVGVVYDIGGRGDQSFNDSAGAGLDAAKKELGDKIEAKEIEPNADGSNRKELL